MNQIGKRAWVASAGIAASCALAAFGFVRSRAERALRSAEGEIVSQQNLHFGVADLPQTMPQRFEWINAPAVFTQGAEFKGRLYLCGPAGLYEYSADGKLERAFHPGRELPSSPLVGMASAVLADTGRPELVIATKSEGLVEFNGAGFRQIRPADAAAREITAILPTASGHLLIGTSGLGVLVYDGKRLGPLHPALAGIHVTALAGNESDLWIGTMERGVLHWHGGRTEAFGEGEGLPDPQVLSLWASGGEVFVGTALGVAEFRDGQFTRVVARGAFAQALGVSGRTLYVGTMDQGLIRVALDGKRIPAGGRLDDRAIPDVEQILQTQEDVYAVTRGGIYELSEAGGENRERIEAAEAELTDSNISALMMDAKGSLWTGYFERGLDILGANGRRVRHVENDRVFCVNRIVRVRSGAATAVATANGLVIFDADGNERQVLTRKDGLIADHVTDVAVMPDGMAIATPAGITFLDRKGGRSLYAFQGLVNNHVYTLGKSGDVILAGTLGGITMLYRGDVAGSYTMANSSVPKNWISAVAPLGREWMIGTYGGGVARLDGSGKFHSYDVATGNFEINPNAMLATERHVFAGSLERGLFVYDRSSDRWTNITQGLPSENVTAFAEGGGYIYIGTDNGLVRAREKDFQP